MCGIRNCSPHGPKMIDGTAASTSMTKAIVEASRRGA